ncbi:MAG TPA: type II toxin-antitoxin system HicA family toxin [Candidatus Paceibacterota bacterium]
MPKLPALRPREVIRVLEGAGFVFIRQKGSHRIYIKNNLRITIPFHNKDLKPKTLRHIIKQSGLNLEEFINLL